MKTAFVTYMGNNRYLYGVLALYQSLKEHKNERQLVVLVGPAVTSQVIGYLKEKPVILKMVDEIGNPNREVENDTRGVKFMYSKIRVFELFEYDKIVYLDADMVVCENVEDLFDKPHMSAVIAGKLLRWDWRDFNSGLMVIEPEPSTFANMLATITVLPSCDGTDQGFLNSFYPHWKREESLHLEHRFNLPASWLEHYCKSYDFEFEYREEGLHAKNVSVIHYIGPNKPWDHDAAELGKLKTMDRYQQSVALWWDYFHRSV
ncbi:MAG TPA: glycosyltransferase [Puia sp.]|jgi:glycogenin glucosyltransferase|nr:glycosyltransferase [Puia sp.]